MTPDAELLLADRFLSIGAGGDGRECRLDLATWEVVWCRVERGEAPDSEWLARHAMLYVLRHPHLVELVDYGAFGPSSRFAAFRTRGPLRRWTSPAAAADRAIASAAKCLEDHGLSAGPLRRSHVVSVGGEPRVLVDWRARFAARAGGASPDPVRPTRGAAPSGPEGDLVHVPAAIERIMEFLEAPGAGSRWLQLHPRVGAGASTVLELAAREARLRGFVPVSSRVLEGLSHEGRGASFVEALAGRSLVLLSDRCQRDTNGRRQAVATASAVLALGAAGPRVLSAVVSVGRWNRSAPWVEIDGPPCERRTVVLAAREQPAEFSVDPVAHQRTLGIRRSGTDGYLRIDQARELQSRGRHAAAARAYQNAAARFDRRGDLLRAGAAWYELGRVRQLRGAMADACGAFGAAGRRFRSVGAIRQAIDAASCEADVSIETGQLDVAERLLRAADLAAVHTAAECERMRVRASLLRCLRWQGRSEEAARLTALDAPTAGSVVSHDPQPCGTSKAEAAAEAFGSLQNDAAALVGWHVAAGELALSRRSFEDASTHVMRALTLSRDQPPVTGCGAEILAVRFHGMIGDVAAVRLYAARARRVTMAARAPLELRRLRVALMTAWVQVGASREAHTLASRLLRRRRPSTLLVDAELSLVLGRVLPESGPASRLAADARAFAEKHTIAGLLDDEVVPGRFPEPVSDIVDLLQRTHECEDEGDVLIGLVERLKTRLSALAVTIVPAEDPDAAMIAAGTGRGTAPRRALEAGIVLGPLRTAAGIEIAAPIRCGGASVGSLAARWAAGGPDRADHARALIATAASVAGPFLKAIIDARGAAAPSAVCPELLGTGPRLADLRRAIARAAAAPFSVLITGESGVGKELVARAIHEGSARRLRRFVPLNCAALTDELLESELFGHARGAFTGAVAERRGVFEEADEGTVFLDEVSELSARAQAKLLRVLQEHEVRRVGESVARPVDVRIVAASNRSLEAGDDAPFFRQDLRYRLDVIRIEVPPLRERVEDVPLLAAAFWAQSARLTGCKARLGSALMAALARYDWPGNVRELQNTMAALAVAAPRHGIVGPSLLPAAVARAVCPPASRLEDARRAFERRFVAAALARAGHRTGPAARSLGISRQGLLKMMKRLGLGKVLQ